MILIKIKRHFKGISIIGRLAFGIVCLQQYVLEKQISIIWTDRLIATLWAFTTAEDLTAWDEKIRDLSP